MHFSFIISSAALVAAQYTPGGPTQPGLPAGCIGSFPNIPDCEKYNWSLPYSDPCAPPGPYPVAGQQVYIKDATNFCLNLPNPNSIFLQNNFYNASKYPTIVQAEGFVQSFCMGDYLPPGSLKLPAGGIRSAHVVKYANYIQIHGRLDCAALNINCTMSAPGAYDDGGQYDDGAFKNCGKEPYSGVDSSDNGNAGMQHYVEMAGNGLYCMRVCAPGTMVQGGVCDVTQDTAGCIAFMGVQFTQEESFTYTDTLTGVTTTASVKLPPMKTSTTTTTTTTTTTVAVATGATTANGAIATGTSSTGGNKASDVSALAPSTGVLGLLGLLFGAVMV